MLEQAFKNYIDMVYPNGCTVSQLSHLKKSFYAGCLSTMLEFMKVCEDGDSDESAIKLDVFMHECIAKMEKLRYE